jgi:hypothetical protein
MLKEIPTCPFHKATLRQLSTPLDRIEQDEITASYIVLECAVPGCHVLYSVQIAPAWDGFFKLDEDGKVLPLSRSPAANGLPG